MKQVLVILGLTVFASISLAAPNHVALCGFDENDLVGISKQAIQEMATLSPLQDKMVQQYLQKLEYTNKDLTLREIQYLFAEEYKYDELNFSTYQAQSTGAIYHNVVSYPGDNEYGLIFDNSGNLVADINDGDIVLHENGKDVWCYDLAE